MSWRLVWEIAFCAAIGVFTLVSLIVANKGYRDIRSLLNDLRTSGGSRESQEGSGGEQSENEPGNVIAGEER